jgi:hypothetical protein
MSRREKEEMTVTAKLHNPTTLVDLHQLNCSVVKTMKNLLNVW